MSVIRPYIPRENSISDAVYCYLSCERAVLDEMRARVSSWAWEHLGPDWHRIVRDDPNLWEMSGWKQPEDAFYILKCLAVIPVSKISHVFGHPRDIGPKAKPVFLARNRWSHFSNQLVMSTIRLEIKQLLDFAQIIGLDVAEAVEESLRELVRLASSEVTRPATLSPKTSRSERADSPVRRPRVGEPWFEELPDEVWEISEKLRDVRAKSDGQSLKSRWGKPDEAKFEIARLFHLNLSPRVLYVDPRDGATVGFREGHAYLVGYAGAQPDVANSEYQGFFEEVTFQFTGNDLLQTDTREPAFPGWGGRAGLIQMLRDSQVSDDDEVLITDFGDVVAISEEGARRVATIDKASLQLLWESL